MPEKSEIKPVPAVNIAIINEYGEILLTQRSATVREPHKWCLPGGHLEFGEKWSVGCRRETEEEVGVQIQNETLCGIYSDPSVTVTKEKLPEGYHAQFIVALFTAKKFTGEITTNDEVEDWDWFTIDNLPEPMIVSHVVRVKDALSFKGEVFVR